MKTLTTLLGLTLLLPCVLASGNVIWTGGDDDAPIRRKPVIVRRPVPVRKPVVLAPFRPPVKVAPYYRLRQYLFVDSVQKKPAHK
jgi:hypothetical protein